MTLPGSLHRLCAAKNFEGDTGGEQTNLEELDSRSKAKVTASQTMVPHQTLVFICWRAHLLLCHEPVLLHTFTSELRQPHRLLRRCSALSRQTACILHCDEIQITHFGIVRTRQVHHTMEVLLAMQGSGAISSVSLCAKQNSAQRVQCASPE